MNDRVDSFLRKYVQHADDIDIDASLQLLAKDIQAGLNREQSSIYMIPSFLTTDVKVKAGVRNILIDAGGTNLRICTGSVDSNGKVTLDDYYKTHMPGIRKEITADEFYRQVAKSISPLADKGKDIGFCYSYGAVMMPTLDGISYQSAKEVKVKGIKGTMVGASTLNALRKYSATERRIVILNDTVATLLGGKMCLRDADYSTYIGYIIGTGTNVSYVEDCTNIKRLPQGSVKGKMIINTEVGNFDKLNRGTFDRIVDSQSEQPNSQLAEKMCSGRYLSLIIKQAINQAVIDGLFSGRVELDKDFFDASITDTAVWNKYMSGDRGGKAIAKYFGIADNLVVKDIVTGIIDRAAKVGALLVSAFAIKSNCGYSQDSPIAIVAEGTTFYRLYSFRQRFEHYLSLILQPKGIYYKIGGGQELNMLGTLLASMSHND